MKSIQDKGTLNLASTHETPGGGNGGGGGNFEFQKGTGGANRGGSGAHSSHHHRTALGKPTPSKWDDAQKWLVNLSRVGDKSHSTTEPRDSNADDRRLIAPVPKKDYPSSEDEEQGDGNLVQYEPIETKKVDFGDSVCVRSICVRDMGTEMTPMASQEPSRSATPVRATTLAARSPTASGSSTPVRPGGGPGAGPATVAPKVDVSGNTTRFARESEESNGENVVETRNPRQDSTKLDPLETRAMAWDEAERAKYMARFKREEVKIEAWENHEKRKAEMEMKRMEAKAERLKSRAQEKYTNKLASTRRIAEEKRAKAEAILNEKAVKTCEKADYIRRNGHLPSSFSIKLPSCCCW